MRTFLCKLLILVIVYSPLQMQSVAAESIDDKNHSNGAQNAQQIAQIVTPHQHETDRATNQVLGENPHAHQVLDNTTANPDGDACNNHDSCNQCVGCVFSVYVFNVDRARSHNFNLDSSRYLITPQANYRPPCIS